MSEVRILYGVLACSLMGKHSADNGKSGSSILPRPTSLRSVRLAVKDAALSRLKHGFDSRTEHQLYALLAQLAEASDLGSEGSQFESEEGHHPLIVNAGYNARLSSGNKGVGTPWADHLYGYSLIRRTIVSKTISLRADLGTHAIMLESSLIGKITDSDSVDIGS